MSNGYKDERKRYVRSGTETAKGPLPGDEAVGARRNVRKLKIISGVLCALLLVGGTFAWLHDILVPKVNAFSFGKTSVTIDEDFNGWNYKRVRLKIEDMEENVPSVVRAMIFPTLKFTGQPEEEAWENMDTWYDPTGTATPNQIIMGDLRFTLDEHWADNWFFKDGFFYYRSVLNRGEMTPYLLQKVDIWDSLKMSYYNKYVVEIEVMADAIQAAGGAPEEAWGVYVDGTTVKPTP